MAAATATFECVRCRENSMCESDEEELFCFFSFFFFVFVFEVDESRMMRVYMNRIGTPSCCYY